MIEYLTLASLKYKSCCFRLRHSLYILNAKGIYVIHMMSAIHVRNDQLNSITRLIKKR